MTAGKKQKNASATICHCRDSEDPIPTEDTIFYEADMVGWWSRDDPPYYSDTVLQTHRNSDIFSIKWKFSMRM